MLIFCYASVLVFLFLFIFHLKEMLEFEQKQYEKMENMYKRNIDRKDAMQKEIIETYQNSNEYLRSRIKQLENQSKKKFWNAQKIRHNSSN